MRPGARWRDRVGPPIALLGVALLLTAVIPAGSRILAAEARADGCSASPAAAARAALRDASDRAFARVREQLGRRGELTGRALSVDRAGRPGLNIFLPAESYVAPRVGDLVVYTRDSAVEGSSVHLVDVEGGCDLLVAEPADVVRSAIVDPAASTVYLHSVTRGDRRDNGVHAIDMATGAGRQVVPPLPPSDEHGPTFGTELRWSLDGTALAVQSCGFEACRTRVLDPASGAVVTYDGHGQGAMIGLTNAHLLTFADCPGLPCAVLSVDLASGVSTLLAEDALGASIRAAGNGTATLTIETAAGMLEVTQ